MRMFREGPEGFKGGLSAGKYSTITGASPATTTPDLADLTGKGALIWEGEHRHAGYKLSVPMRPVPHVSLMRAESWWKNDFPTENSRHSQHEN